MPTMRHFPRHRTIFAVAIESFTRYPDPIKACLRRSTFELVQQALHAGRFADSYRDPFIDRGNGLLTLIRPHDQAPKTVLVDCVVPALSSLLAEHNARHPDQSYRLRAVVHAGEVPYDENGPFGEAIDVAHCLRDADPVKRALRAAKAPIALVVSDEVYRCVVRHGYDGTPPNAYRRLQTPRVYGQIRPGWVRAVGPSDLWSQRPSRTQPVS